MGSWVDFKTLSVKRSNGDFVPGNEKGFGIGTELGLLYKVSMFLDEIKCNGDEWTLI